MKMIKKINSCEILFVIPALVYMLIFVGYPIVYNVVLSFQDTTLMNIGSASKEFVGLQNYKNIFSSPLIFITLKNTLFYTVMCLIIQFSLGFLMALFSI